MDVFEARNILGLGQDASQEELKDAYRRMAKQYHPDVNTDAGAASRFQQISAAYQVLQGGNNKADISDLFWEEDLQKAWREEQRARNARQAYEKARRHQQTLHKVYRVLNPMITAYMVFLGLLMLDFILPRQTHDQEIVKVLKVYEGAGRNLSNAYHSHSLVYFSDFRMQVSREKKILPAAGSAIVYTTPILKTVMKAEPEKAAESPVLEPQYSIYHRFGLLILLAFVLGVIYFKQSPHKERRLNVGVLMLFLAIFHLVILLRH